ncbi:hypothetical protein U1Q18_031130, partial [Sarracenia purpurea var. burkii]
YPSTLCLRGDDKDDKKSNSTMASPSSALGRMDKMVPKVSALGTKQKGQNGLKCLNITELKDVPKVS